MTRSATSPPPTAVTPAPTVPGPPTDRRVRPVLVVGALAAWAALVAAASVVGDSERDVINLQAPPLIASVDPVAWRAVPLVLVLGLALAVWLPRWCARLGWRRLLVVVALVALTWGVSLALVRGTDRLEEGLSGPYEYPAVVAQVDQVGLGRFVDTFTQPEVLETYPVHVEGHPIGAAFVFIGLDRLGIGAPGDAAWVMILLGSATAPAVLLSTREVAGERRARQAAPFLALAPAVIWMVTSADAMFTAVAAWGIALVLLATASHRSTRDRALLAIGGGVVFGIGLHLSYGLVPLLAIPGIVALGRRRFDVLALAAVGGALVVGAFTLGGFWWFDGLAATRVRYRVGIARLRPFSYFIPLGNPAAFAVACGPAVAAALARVRDRRLWFLVAGGVLAVTGADLSGLSKGEIERIWLPFVPWLLVLCAGFADLGRAWSRPFGPPVLAPAAEGPMLRGEVQPRTDEHPAAGSATSPATTPATTPATASATAPATASATASATAPATASTASATGSAAAPTPPPMRWSRLAGAMLVVQVVAAVVVESYLLTPW